MRAMTLHMPTITRLLTSLAILTAVTALTLALRHVAFRAIRRWGSASPSPMTTIVWDSLRLPSMAWCVLIGAYVAVDMAELPPRQAATILKLLFSLLVISVTAAVANLSGAALKQGLRQASLALPATGLSVAFARVLVWIVGALVLLGGLGISVTPVLTALGVGGLAVALALQETLSNFFAGIHLLVEQPVRVGHFIKLETGQEGYVEDIGWRTTRIRMLSNDMVILPNSKLKQSVRTNYYLPDPRRGMSITMSLPPTVDPAQIERLLLEEAARAVGQIPGLLAEPAPAVRLMQTPGVPTLDFTLNCHVREFTDQYLVQHELRKRILLRFRKEGVEPAYPQYIALPPASDPRRLPS